MKVTLLMAITLDGKIGRDPDHFPDWTGSADKRLFADLSRQAGVVIMGSRTFDTIGKPLPGRKTIVMTRNVGRVSDRADLVFTDAQPAEVLNLLAAEGHAHVVLAGGALVNSLFAEAQLIDEMVVTLSPVVFGHGISLFSEEITMDLRLLDVTRVDDQLVCLRFSVIKDERRMVK